MWIRMIIIRIRDPEILNTDPDRYVPVSNENKFDFYFPQNLIFNKIYRTDLFKENYKTVRFISLRTDADPHHCFPVTQTVMPIPLRVYCGMMRPSNTRPLQSQYASPVRRDFYYWNVLFRWEGTETFFNESVREGEGQGLHIIQRGE